MKARIRFEKLMIGTIRNSSGVFAGENRLSGRRDEAKANEGFGGIGGEGNAAAGSAFFLNDRDIVDRVMNGWSNRSSRGE